jgi:hypothetical protein
MAQAAQLKLVTDKAPGQNLETQDATRRVFEHWVFMFDRPVRRCKLGPTRRQVIDAALGMGYDVHTLLLAIEGMAADPLADAPHDRMRDAMREIEWLLAREARIERWAEMGERVRARALRPDEPVAAEPEAEYALPSEEQRARMRAVYAQIRAGRHG